MTGEDRGDAILKNHDCCCKQKTDSMSTEMEEEGKGGILNHSMGGMSEPKKQSVCSMY